MVRRWHVPWGLILTCGLCAMAEAAQPPAAAPTAQLPKLSAEQIAERNVEARGGLKAWRAIHSIQMTGLLDAGGQKDARLPFTLQMKRPHYQRVAIEFSGQTALQVFDGQNGWKLRPFLNRMDVEPFSEEERLRVLHQDDLDGPLIDYAAKGSRLELDGTELLDGKANYRLKLTTHDGTQRHVWIDGRSFLETKIEGSPRYLNGRMRGVENHVRDWRKVEGVLIPFESDTEVETAAKNRKITIEKVVLNPSLEDRLFGKPAAPPGPTAAQLLGKGKAGKSAPGDRAGKPAAP